MYFFDRKTVYLIWKKKDLWRKSVGNVRFLVIEDLCRIELMITDCGAMHGRYLVSVLSGDNASVIGEIFLDNGRGTMSIRCKTSSLGDRKIPYTILTGVKIDLEAEGVLEQRWIPKVDDVLGREEVIEEAEVIDQEEEFLQEDVIQLYANKWQQLCNIYPVAYPFEDGRAYLSIEPRDFVVLQAKYQGLVQNSFLLHSFYQNKHILLGRSRRGNQINYYIGVAGIYCDKEKNMARLHGFESFEGKEEQTPNGGFGYYMKRVEI